MSSKKWKLEYIDGFERLIRKVGSTELKQFKIKIQDLECSVNPKTLGELKGTKKHGFCYVLNITKSYRLAYTVNELEHIILLVSLDDHKGLYGRDKKS